CDEARLDAVNLIGSGGQLAIGVRLIGAHRDDGERGALPQILMFDFRDGHVEFLQPVLDPPQDHSLVFSRTAGRYMQLDGQKANGHYSRALGPHPQRVLTPMLGLGSSVLGLTWPQALMR